MSFWNSLEDLMRDIHSVNGIGLDTIGVKLVEPRNHREDAQYRIDLKARAMFLYDNPAPWDGPALVEVPVKPDLSWGNHPPEPGVNVEAPVHIDPSIPGRMMTGRDGPRPTLTDAVMREAEATMAPMMAPCTKKIAHGGVEYMHACKEWGLGLQTCPYGLAPGESRKIVFGLGHGDHFQAHHATGSYLDRIGDRAGLPRLRVPLEPDAHYRSRILESFGEVPTGKTRWTEVPPVGLEEMARVMTAAYPKHGPVKLRTVTSKEDMDAALRHVSAYLRGEVRSDLGLHHLAHAAARFLLIVEAELATERK